MGMSPANSVSHSVKQVFTYFFKHGLELQDHGVKVRSIQLVNQLK